MLREVNWWLNQALQQKNRGDGEATCDIDVLVLSHLHLVLSFTRSFFLLFVQCAGDAKQSAVSIDVEWKVQLWQMRGSFAIAGSSAWCLFRQKVQPTIATTNCHKNKEQKQAPRPTVNLAKLSKTMCRAKPAAVHHTAVASGGI